MVQENNAAYFEDEDRNLMHTPIEDEQEIRDVIALISESIEYDLPKLSRAEQDRLNCLLGDLKIVRASGLSLAAVVMETNVLYVNPPMIDVSGFVGFLKGKSTRIIYERHANLKYKYGNRQFWCRGYYVDTAGKNAKAPAGAASNIGLCPHRKNPRLCRGVPIHFTV